MGGSVRGDGRSGYAARHDSSCCPCPGGRGRSRHRRNRALCAAQRRLCRQPLPARRRGPAAAAGRRHRSAGAGRGPAGSWGLRGVPAAARTAGPGCAAASDLPPRPQ
ncbi:hypothetical protein G6F64_015356 [Rhizopus arrhizus]|uniref:Uncharacterized protein n=1 Tax=Rhizopus oryzae TaxID=64495 RepID=A0A9P6WRQ2_RHIOR|nr:hypothetical protein G6F64_015356 [Rhizopus arrhizus]